MGGRDKELSFGHVMFATPFGHSSGDAKSHKQL
jgi:hypothetical protein